jgi:hypothetical protein
MKTPSSESEAAMLRMVSVVRRRLRQQFLAIKGKYPSIATILVEAPSVSEGALALMEGLRCTICTCGRRSL